MPKPVQPRPVRLLRVLSFTGASVSLGAGAHVLGHGARPDAGALAVVVAAVAVLWQQVGRAEQSLPRLLLAVLAVQAGMHLAFLEPVGGMSAGHTGTDGSPALMTVGHGLAALLLAAWLRRGESALWCALRRVLPTLPVPGALPVPVPAGQAPRPAGPVAIRLLLRADPASRRGPPVPARA